MPSINMIAAMGAERKRLEQLIRITAIVIVGEVAIALFIFGFMTTRVYSASQQMGDLDKKLMQLQPTVVKIHDYDAEIKKLEPRLNLLDDSRQQTMLWHSVLRNLACSMPKNTWIGSVATSNVIAPGSGTTKQKPSTMLDIFGTSTSQALVGETMLRMNKFPEFEKVELNYTQGKSDSTDNLVDFRIGATLKPVNAKKAGGADNANKTL